LNAAGREQARVAGEKLKAYSLSALYSSNLLRTMQTAEIIGKILSLTPRSDPRLQEIHFGEWEGKTYPEVFEQYPDEVRVWRECPLKATVPGGEKLEEVLARTLEAINEICATAKGDVVVVTHGGPIRLLLCHIGAEGAMWEYPVKPGSVTILECQGQVFKLVEQI